MSDINQNRVDNAIFSAQDLRNLGRMAVAYVRPAEADGVRGYAIHGADGAVIGFAEERATAVAAILQHGMEPVSLH